MDICEQDIAVAQVVSTWGKVDMKTLRRYHESNTPYFITTSTRKNRPIFADGTNAQMLLNLLMDLRRKGRFLLLSFVIMPDHLHLLIVPGEGENIFRIMHTIKRGSARLVGTGSIWVPRFYDRAIRSLEKLNEAIEYIHYNPVEAGLCSRREDYPYSSANLRIKTELEKYLSGAQVETTWATG